MPTATPAARRRLALVRRHPCPPPRASRRRARHPCQPVRRAPDQHYPTAECGVTAGHRRSRRQARRGTAHHADLLAQAPPPRAARPAPRAVGQPSFGCAVLPRRRPRSVPGASPARHRPPTRQPPSTAPPPDDRPPAPPWPPPNAAPESRQRRGGRPTQGHRHRADRPQPPRDIPDSGRSGATRLEVRCATVCRRQLSRVRR